jgi:phosphoribosylanthranilate isomerase
MRPRIKVCQIHDTVEAWMAIARGADLIGLVADIPGEALRPEDIADIAATCPPGVTPVLLTSARHAEPVIELVRETGVNVVQLLEPFDAGHPGALREALPGIKIIQSVRLAGRQSLDVALNLSAQADALLISGAAYEVETPVPKLADLALCRRVVEEAHCPVFLSGGLSADNIAGALATVRPFGIDVSRGISTAGGLDEGKLRGLIAELPRY